MFAGTDTTSLALTWCLFLLAAYPAVQARLRAELLSVLPAAPVASLTDDEVQSLYAALAGLPLLENVLRETLRLIPPVHSSIRVATRDDVVPASTPIKRRAADGTIVEDDVRRIAVPKGTFIHVPIEGFNLDKELWGASAWSFECVCRPPCALRLPVANIVVAAAPTAGTTSPRPCTPCPGCTTTCLPSPRAPGCVPRTINAHTYSC